MLKGLSRVIYRLTYDRIAYEPIREDYLRWYIECYRSRENELSMDNQELVTMTLDSGREAREFAPETPLHTAITGIEDIRQILMYFFALITVSSILLTGFLVWLGISGTVPVYFPNQSEIFITAGVICLIPAVGGYPFYYVITRTMFLNTQLIREYNKELVISPGRIMKRERFRDSLISYYVWHSSLCSTTKQAEIVLLGSIRKISPRIYGYICYRISQNIQSGFEDNLLRILGREYQLYHQRFGG